MLTLPGGASAVGAEAGDFQRLGFHLKPRFLGNANNLLAEFWLVEFYGYTTGATNQKMALVFCGR